MKNRCQIGAYKEKQKIAAKSNFGGSWAVLGALGPLLAALEHFLVVFLPSKIQLFSSMGSKWPQESLVHGFGVVWEGLGRFAEGVSWELLGRLGANLDSVC